MRHVNIAVFVPHSGCPNQCSFCNQRAISGHTKQPTPQDVIDVCEVAQKGGCEEAEVQLAFFGGSFTAIEREYMVSLLEAAQGYIENGFLNRGIRISTRPDFIDGEILTLLKKYGVRAIELGAQSMDDGVLTLNKRGHTAHDVRKAAVLIKEYGFELGLQMMTGLWGSSDEDSINTAKEFIALKPDTVRIYPTVVLKNTLLGEKFESGEYSPPDLQHSIELVAELLPMFEENGISVIRVGLHAQSDVERDYLAGAYHPALRELCEGEIYYKKILSDLQNQPKGSYEIAVSPCEISKATGQKKKNILRLAEQGYSCKVIADKDIQPFEIRIVTKCF